MSPTSSIHTTLTPGAPSPAHIVLPKVPGPHSPHTLLDSAGFHTDTAYNSITQPSDHHAQ